MAPSNQELKQSLSNLELTSPNWSPEKQPIDYVLLGGAKIPGYTEIVGVNSLRKLQLIRGPGFSGAEYRYLGMEIVEFSLKVHLQDDKDFKDWQVFSHTGVAGAALTNPDFGGKLNPITIWHPFLADPIIHITMVVVKDVLQPVPDGETGGWMIEIKLSNYKKIKVAQGTYKKPKGPEPDARDQRNQAAKAANDQRKANLATMVGTPGPAPK